MPSWKQIHNTNFSNFLNNGHHAFALITGKLSNITVFDFDDINEYNKLLNIYPNLSNYRTIKTNKGVHIYFNYNSLVKTTTDALKSYSKVDVRNDDAIVFCPPTTYKLKNNTVCKYEDMHGNLLPIPDIILNDLKQNDTTNTTNTVIQESKTNHTKTRTNNKIPNKMAAEHFNLSFIENAINNGYLTHKSLSYNDWRDVGFIIHHTSQSDEAFKLFDLFSQLNPDKYEEKYTKKFWDTIKQTTDKPLTIATLKKWINEAKSQLVNPIICTNDLDAINHIYEEIKHKFKYYDGRLFYLHEHAWIYNYEFINNELSNYIINSNIYSSFNEETGKYIPFVQNVHKTKSVLEGLYFIIKSRNRDNELYNKFHTSTKGKICFNDGVLDFQTKTFNTWNQLEGTDIFTTIVIERDYHSYFCNPDLETVDYIKNNIFETAYGDKTELALHFLSRAIAGHHEDKRWATYLGNRNSGKGVEYDLLRGGFENYVSSFELGNMLYCRKTLGLENVDCSKKLYWLIDLEFVRLAISQEIPNNNAKMVINGKILKKITGGGDTIIARRNYDKKDTHFKLDTTFYIKGNNTLECDTPDCNETRIEFNSVVQFKSQEEIKNMTNDGIDENVLKRYKIADPSIKNKCNTLEWKNAIVYLIFQHYKNTRVTMKNNCTYDDNELIRAILQNFEITNKNDDFILCSEVNDILEGFDKGKIMLELQCMNVLKKKCKIRESLLRDKICYFGIKQKNKNVECEIVV